MWLAGVGSKVRHPWPRPLNWRRSPVLRCLSTSNWRWRAGLDSPWRCLEQRPSSTDSPYCAPETAWPTRSRPTFRRTTEVSPSPSSGRPLVTGRPPHRSESIFSSAPARRGTGGGGRAAGLAGWLEQQAEMLMPPIVERIHVLNGVGGPEPPSPPSLRQAQGRPEPHVAARRFRGSTAHLDWAATCEGERPPRSPGWPFGRAWPTCPYPRPRPRPRS